jgi:Ca2+-binding RTX toxin-like protein
MTVFKATQPVTMTASSVAGIFGFLSHNPVFEITNGNELKLENSAHTIEVDFRSVAGHPFTYGPHGPTGGLLASLQVNEPAGAAHIAFKFSGMSVSMATLVSDVQHGQYGAALNLFLGGNDRITGSTGADHLAGFGGNDRIIGGAGNDTMSGGAGNDTFVFVHSGFGNDVITDFTTGTLANHDTIELHSVPGLSNFAMVKALATVVNIGGVNHVVIHDAGVDTIQLNSVHAVSQLHSYDFHFMA